MFCQGTTSVVPQRRKLVQLQPLRSCVRVLAAARKRYEAGAQQATLMRTDSLCRRFDER